MIAYAVNGVIIFFTYLDILTQQKPIISSMDVAHFPEFSIASIGGQIATANIAASSAAYVLTWIGTVKCYPHLSKDLEKSNSGQS